MNVSDNFSKNEIECRCGCGQAIIDKNLYKILEAFRSFNGDKRMITHCVNRCPKHNRISDGVKNSKHVTGRAWDGHTHGMSIDDLHKSAQFAYDKGIISGGLGFYSWGIHIDSGKKRTWKG